MAKVAELGCIIGNEDCGGGLQLHHIIKGGGKRATHFEVIPLCFNHHHAQTPLKHGEAVHKGRKTWESKYGLQTELLKETLRRIEYV